MSKKNDKNFVMLVAFNMFLLVFGLLLFVLAAVVTTAQSAEYSGKVVGISDGDTLTLLVPDGGSFKQVKVRLAEIDTPESAQPYGTRAKQALSDLAFNKHARVIEQDKDRYGRVVGRVYVGVLDVNAELVKLGAAWVYRQYARDRSLYALEDQAKAAKRGLWNLSEAEKCAPWDWRKGTCSMSAATPQPPPVGFNSAKSTGTFTCSIVKRRCAEMTSCDEAKFYLVQCGVTTIDGNRDGVPCEKLCH